MNDLLIASVDELDKGITIPAHTTAEYYDAGGNLVAHYDMPRNYAKNCNIGHLGELAFPVTVKFKQHEPEMEAQHSDQDF